MKRLLFAVAVLSPVVAWGDSSPLKFKTYRDWDLELPEAEAKPLSGPIVLEGMKMAFNTGVEGTALQVDKDGDGNFDVKVTGESGLVTLQGETQRYALRVANQGTGWHAMPGGAMVGKVRGQQVRLIDQNLNGRFDDYGVDAMIVGRGKHASFLSRVINVRGDLVSIAVAPDGTSVTWEPYQGERGTLDFGTSFASKGKLLGAVVVESSKQLSYTLTSRAMTVPAGNYQLHQGRIGLGRNVVSFGPGKMGMLAVTAGETMAVTLGEPVTIDFKYVRQPGRVIMAPQLVSYVGKAGEVYDQWTPFGGSPQFEVKDMESGKQLAIAVFGGC